MERCFWVAWLRPCRALHAARGVVGTALRSWPLQRGVKWGPKPPRRMPLRQAFSKGCDVGGPKPPRSLPLPLTQASLATRPFAGMPRCGVSAGVPGRDHSGEASLQTCFRGFSGVRSFDALSGVPGSGNFTVLSRDTGGGLDKVVLMELRRFPTVPLSFFTVFCTLRRAACLFRATKTCTTAATAGDKRLPLEKMPAPAA